MTAAELQAFVKQLIAPYKAPEELRFRAELPKDPTGKIHRRTLREQAIRERAEAGLLTA